MDKAQNDTVKYSVHLANLTAEPAYRCFSYADLASQLDLKGHKFTLTFKGLRKFPTSPRPGDDKRCNDGQNSCNWRPSTIRINSITTSVYFICSMW